MNRLDQVLEEIKVEFGFEQASLVPLKTPLTIEFYENWIKDNNHGSMSYLSTQLPTKKDPKKLGTSLKSAFVFTHNYSNYSSESAAAVPTRTALYAQSKDYHFWLKDKLKAVIAQLIVEFPNDTFEPYVDSGPVLERDLAYRAGLGWFGKNTCLIHPRKGSFFFIAEILCSIDLSIFKFEFNPEIPDFCGTCTRCIDICPTGALEKPLSLNANKCISYLTIESKTVPPVDLRKKIGDWFFGCDLCQSVCPWNQKILKSNKQSGEKKFSIEQSFQLSTSERQQLIVFFKALLEMSGKKIQKHFAESPLIRAGHFGLKRNALVVIANQNLFELRQSVEKYTEDIKLSELAKWTLDQLNA